MRAAPHEVWHRVQQDVAQSPAGHCATFFLLVSVTQRPSPPAPHPQGARGECCAARHDESQGAFWPAQISTRESRAFLAGRHFQGGRPKSDWNRLPGFGILRDAPLRASRVDPSPRFFKPGNRRGIAVCHDHHVLAPQRERGGRPLFRRTTPKPANYPHDPRPEVPGQRVRRL
jgi:hypothetical protein